VVAGLVRIFDRLDQVVPQLQDVGRGVEQQRVLV